MLTEFLPSLSHVFTASSEKDPKVARARANAAKERLGSLFDSMSFTAMTLSEFAKFVKDNYDDLFTNQTADFSRNETNKNMSEILKLLFKHSDFATSEAVRTLYSTLPAQVLALLPHQEGRHRRVHILPLQYRDDHCNGKSSVHTDLLQKYRKHGLQGSAVPRQLGSARMRLMALFGILKPGFCDKSLTHEQLTKFLSEEAKHRR